MQQQQMRFRRDESPARELHLLHSQQQRQQQQDELLQPVSSPSLPLAGRGLYRLANERGPRAAIPLEYPRRQRRAPREGPPSYLPPSPPVSETSCRSLSAAFVVPQTMLPRPLDTSDTESAVAAAAAAATAEQLPRQQRNPRESPLLYERAPRRRPPTPTGPIFLSGGLYPVVARKPEDLFS